MKCVGVVCVLSAFLAVSLAAPATVEQNAVGPLHHQVKRQTDNSNALNRIITFSNNKIQTLRRLCPQLFQVIDNVIQNVTSQVFRVVGGALLRSGGLGGGGGSGGSGGGGRVSVVLPTFPPDEDEDDDDDDDGDVPIINRTSSPAPNPLSALQEINEIDGEDKVVSNETDGTTTASPTTVVNLDEMLTSPSIEVTRNVRKVREAASDRQAVAPGPDPAEDLSDVEAEDSERNKRYLPFGGDGQGSAGGSGNFLFDLIRLVSGSGSSDDTEEKTASVGGAVEIDVSPKVNHDGEGIPGPITRLLVVANRGIANLIQDLILRLAQTSERIVNFKARLVTALI
ncbi:hypothetical protein PPYR_07630 [Photinus pyralis]|uniref:Uncharacterized protein n=2 Tax=Photinus pyralis TaxID=7054 RepID=A0A5N4AQZ6_PHOPY|nr:ankyrin repeat domain-containing protein 17 [Photinus pyralis]KAB0799750.1 hypothetical protein PPYR_07630 [Photinus pyralis]